MRFIRKKQLDAVAFMVLLAAALAVLLGRKGGALSGRNRDFVPANIAAIDRIVITGNGSGLKLELTDEGIWTVNKESTVRSDRMALLLSFMERLEIVSPVSKWTADGLVRNLNEEGTRVQVFVRGRLDKDFLIGYDSTDIRGTYLMLVGKEVPYRVHLKGYQGDNLANIFAHDGRSWQDNVLLDLGPEMIREVGVAYPSQSDHSFLLQHNGPADFMLSGETGPVPDSMTDLQEMEDYLYFFSNIRYEYPSETMSANALAEDSPFVVLHVVSTNGREYSLTGYRMRISENDTGNGEDGSHMTRFMGVIHDDRDTVMLEYRDMDPIFRRLEDFQKK